MRTSAGLTPNRPAVDKAGKKRKTKKAAKAGISRPAGVSPELHREIMRRINNRFYDAQGICSLRTDGPGLPELAGLIPLARNLEPSAICHYEKELAQVRRTLNGCMRCEGKLFAVLHLLHQNAGSDKATQYLVLMLEREAFLRDGGTDRDFLAEVREAAQKEEHHLRVT